jgi:hypothetical protein
MTCVWLRCISYGLEMKAFITFLCTSLFQPYLLYLYLFYKLVQFVYVFILTFYLPAYLCICFVILTCFIFYIVSSYFIILFTKINFNLLDLIYKLLYLICYFFFLFFLSFVLFCLLSFFLRFIFYTLLVVHFTYVLNSNLTLTFISNHKFIWNIYC